VTKAAPKAPETREDVRESTILSMKKRIMGRKASLPAVRRIATETGLLVARALEQPVIQHDLRVLAATAGMTLPEYKAHWKRMQEADLLLESGGDPNAHSVADAIGIAQWLASTGRHSGNLRIDVGASRRLSGQIAQLQATLNALQQRPETWSKPAPAGAPKPKVAAKPAVTAVESLPATPQPAAPATTSTTQAPLAPPTDAAAPGTEASSSATSPTASTPPPATAASQTPAVTPEPRPAEPTPAPRAEPNVWTRDQWIAHTERQIRQLEAKRRVVDERYDPAKAIAAQTRYVVRLARRYGTLDWAFQAYHGGEGGVQRTVSSYLGRSYPQFASAGAAIRGELPHRGGSQRVRPMLDFEDLYFGTTPRSHPEAFSYLYGRSDHHRYYWWKILMAERAIALYRDDPEEFLRQWRALRPGQRMEVAWYPNAEELSFDTVADLKQGYESGDLVRLPADLKRHGLAAGNVAPMDAANAYHYKGLRPAAMGTLLRVAELYRKHGGGAPLGIHSLVHTTNYTRLLEARYPPPWVRNPPEDPADLHIDLHATGYCFDLERPSSAWNRKVLEYALGHLADRGRIYWVDETIYGPRRYHVCPSPDHSQELTRTYRAALPSSGKKG
jgi:hypothetical protein